VAFPNPRRSEEQDVIAAPHVAAACQLADQLRVDRRLEFEVGPFDGPWNGETRHRDAHLMMLLGFRTDLERQEIVEEIGVGNLLLAACFRRAVIPAKVVRCL
jgi:hypothetical protein